ncbi:glycosyltransferase [Flagellimonas zhangzhouensis]|uniref:Glycosyltransferase involved in cell wall bisynthesis n=1 Tax=Flagellimonas zhangzhouensis TaxID=1073328 RepID=A0A1H2YQ80_9FLAO|nr:glycosyltransferase [Allomuricauda zhangzhouensis]SDR00515.1 Glycosyltransferase involved in cell wall bisynthesis [Allomuricauda zhangzhouensis]SDX07327.1 Glycosyltransferase involved in cell wall bisynthesis [Allomuricauda zhangzhouensis]
MKLSILIPLYNKEKYIERCFKSLLTQDLSPDEYEVIVVDDGSKDAGAAIVQEYSEKNTNIQLIKQKNQGPSAARNKCLAAATGDYVYFLDADDYLAINVLKSLIGLAEQNKLEILEFNTKQIPEGSELIEESSTKNTKDLVVKVKDGISYVADYSFRNEAWRYIVKRNLLLTKDIKFIEGTLYEDAIFTASLFLNADRMAKVNMDIHRYIVVENSIVTSKDRAHNLKFIKGMINAIEHFHGLIENLDTSHSDYTKVVKNLKGRQQALVFALIIRTLKFRLLSFDELKEILMKLKTLGAYPIDPKIGGVGQGKTAQFYNMTFVPIFNNKSCLYLGMGLMKIMP